VSEGLGGAWLGGGVVETGWGGWVETEVRGLSAVRGGGAAAAAAAEPNQPGAPSRLPSTPTRPSYNLRVVECRLAAALMARKLGTSVEAAARVKTLREVEPMIAERFGPGLEGKLKAVEELLGHDTYLQDRVRVDARGCVGVCGKGLGMAAWS